MKKFSSISGTKVSTEPKVEISKELEELDNMKYSVMELMNQFLRIQSYGVARKNILPTVKITGQELFIEALIGLLSDKTYKDQIKALESLKSNNKDWESIDEKINNINQEIQKNQDLKSISNHIQKVKNLIDVYGNDKENFTFVVEKYTDKITDFDTAYQRSIAAKVMMENSKFKNYPKDQLSLIFEKFLDKAKSLKSC